jgi:hypothetical protein
MQTYRIDHGVRLPEPQHRSGPTTASKAALTMQQLDPGDSFLIKDFADAIAAQKCMRDFNRRERARTGGRQFASRRVKNGVRIWRIV